MATLLKVKLAALRDFFPPRFVNILLLQRNYILHPFVLHRFFIFFTPSIFVLGRCGFCSDV